MRIDKWLCTSFVALVAAGLVLSFSIPGCSWTKHSIWVLLGIASFVGLSLLDYHVLKGYAMALYGLLLASLVAILVFGSFTRGSRAWFDLGLLKAQPSELGKPILVVALAYLASECRGEILRDDLRRLLVVGGIPLFLVLIEPDLGQSLVYAIIVFGILLFGGVSRRYLILLTASAGLLAVLAFASPLVAEYQKQRLQAFTQQDRAVITSDPASYNLAQSRIAIGSGGWFGKGFRKGSQTRLAYVPEQCTDFVFTAVAEQFGFVGSVLILALFSILIWRILHAAATARDYFGTLIAGAIAVMMVFQIFQNVGMTMGIMPITGLPLPLLSYGGSSMLATSASLGLVHSVYLRRFG
jgi:rod shape determining protein RodA